MQWKIPSIDTSILLVTSILRSYLSTCPLSKTAQLAFYDSKLRFKDYSRASRKSRIFSSSVRTNERNEANTRLSSSVRIAVRLERLTVSDLAFSWRVDSHRTLSIICVKRMTLGNGGTDFESAPAKRHCLFF